MNQGESGSLLRSCVVVAVKIVVRDDIKNLAHHRSKSMKSESSLLLAFCGGCQRVGSGIGCLKGRHGKHGLEGTVVRRGWGFA